ncbi:MAG: hypothetical protein BGN97_11475 [Microbacterium sp. 69-10]|nr:MAG: hypothetical protein BGN97_11475 [Microbacterium sp. 69-10]
MISAPWPPARAVLIGEQHRIAAAVDAGGKPRCCQFHEREQAVHLGFPRHEAPEDTRQSHGLPPQVGSHPVLPAAGRVRLVEDQVEHSQDGTQA